jgi:hypothetical protein
MSNMSDSDVSESVDDDLDQPDHDGTSQIALLLHQISDQLGSLYNLSSLLRRPRVADKYIKSVDSRPETDSKDPEITPLHVGLTMLDECHVAEKILQWRGLSKTTYAFDEDEAPAAPDNPHLTSQAIEDCPWLCQRLARANTRRRDQLQYWARKPYERTPKPVVVQLDSLPRYQRPSQ